MFIFANCQYVIAINLIDMNDKLQTYLQEIDEETQLLMNEYVSRPLAFTAYILDEISELINIDEYKVVYGSTKDSAGRTRGEIYGYGLSTNHEVLTLFYTLYDSSSDGTVKNVTEQQYQTALNRLQGFYNSSIRGLYFDLSENDSLYEPAKLIDEVRSELVSINLIVLSNCTINGFGIKNLRICGKNAYPDVWDLKKIYANLHSGSDHIAINVDFINEYSNYKIPYIEMESAENNYKCYLAMFPAKLLYKLYEKYNTNLLLNNVRYFLGFKGSKKNNANIGIQETLREESHMFLAYNNGITAIASGIEAVSLGEKTDVGTLDEEGPASNEFIRMGILQNINDFQIVNGGQTTASIFFAKNKDKNISLHGVYVQVKLVVLSNNINEVAAKITRFSNSQNKIKYADFSISNAFNMRMQELSRSVVIPSEKNQQQYWYFERVRGQYDVEKKLCLTKESLQYFNWQYPKELKFKKELLAKVWKSWQQEPFDAVKGEATNYDMYISKLVESAYVPDENYYMQSISLLIIYNFLASRPDNKDYKNRKAAIIAYTIAYLNYITFGKLNLLKIWKSQSLSDNLKSYLNKLCNEINDALIYLAEDTSVLSYSKRKIAFNELTKYGIYVGIDLSQDDLN